MEKRSTIVILGAGLALLAIAASFLPLQPQPARAPNLMPQSTSQAGSNMTTGSNMTGPAANMTGGTPTANPAGHQLGKDNPSHVPLARNPRIVS